MSATIIAPDQDSIVSEIEVAAPRERVFKALSDAGELARWFGSPECPLKFWKMDARCYAPEGHLTIARRFQRREDWNIDLRPGGDA